MYLHSGFLRKKERELSTSEEARFAKKQWRKTWLALFWLLKGPCCLRANSRLAPSTQAFEPPLRPPSIPVWPYMVLDEIGLPLIQDFVFQKKKQLPRPFVGVGSLKYITTAVTAAFTYAATSTKRARVEHDIQKQKCCHTQMPSGHWKKIFSCW